MTGEPRPGRCYIMRLDNSQHAIAYVISADPHDGVAVVSFERDREEGGRERVNRTVPLGWLGEEYIGPKAFRQKT